MKPNVVTITPKLAAEWLESNTNNRPLSPSRISRLAEVIASGLFQENGETIIFTEDGALLDGQHRLAAVVQAGKSIRSLVVRGVKPTAMETIDTGATRRSRDILHLSGHVNTTLLATVTGHYMLAKRQGLAGMLTHRRARLQPIEMLRELETHSWIQTVVDKVTGSAVRRFGAHTALGVLGCIIREFSAQQKRAMLAWESFVEQIETGADLGRESPIYHLRERMLARGHGSRGYTDEYKYALVVRAWNLYYLSESFTRLAFRPGFDFFPVIADLKQPNPIYPDNGSTGSLR